MKKLNHYYTRGFHIIDPAEKIAFFASDEEATLHKHDFIELIFFQTGVGEHIIEDETFIVKSGEFYLLNTGIEHSYSIYKNTKNPVCVTNLLFYANFLDDSLSSNNFINEAYQLLMGKPLSRQINFIRFHTDENRSFAQLFSLIEKEFKYKQSLYLENISFLFKSLLIKLFRSVTLYNDNHHKLSISQLSVAENAIKHIEENYNEDLTLCKLAKIFAYSSGYLNKLIYSFSGMNFKKIQQTIRCKKACELLCTTKLPVGEICYLVGYKDAKQFFLVFKRIIGVSPKQYQKTNINKDTEEASQQA